VPLATRCPNCTTIFRVTVDQLRLRGGMVRCGHCGAAFDANSALSQFDPALDPSPDPASADAAADPAPAPTDDAAPVVAEATETKIGNPPGTETPQITAAADTTDELDAPRTPADFLGTDPRAQPTPWSVRLLVLLLGTALIAQAVYLYRSDIVAQWPPTRPAFAWLCKQLNCQLPWPARGEYLAVVGSDLLSVPGAEALELNVVVRNRAAVTMELPALEVTLSDFQNRPVARKVFPPRDYRATADRIAAGLAAGADLEIKLTFEARGLAVAGFVVYPFYP
jgi:predicted Zn finger-like uncharacterized protein